MCEMGGRGGESGKMINTQTHRMHSRQTWISKTVTVGRGALWDNRTADLHEALPSGRWKRTREDDTKVRFPLHNALGSSPDRGRQHLMATPLLLSRVANSVDLSVQKPAGAKSHCWRLNHTSEKSHVN